MGVRCSAVRRYGFPVISVANEHIRKHNYVCQRLPLEVSILNRCTRDDCGVTKLVLSAVRDY